MKGGDDSLVGGLISAATLIALNYGVGLATYKSRRLEVVIEGRPEVLVHNGKIFEDVMARAQLSQDELESAIRQAGCASVEDVQSAILENNGAISVIQRKPSPDGPKNKRGAA